MPRDTPRLSYSLRSVRQVSGGSIPTKDTKVSFSWDHNYIQKKKHLTVLFLRIYVVIPRGIEFYEFCAAFGYFLRKLENTSTAFRFCLQGTQSSLKKNTQLGAECFSLNCDPTGNRSPSHQYFLQPKLQKYCVTRPRRFCAE